MSENIIQDRPNSARADALFGVIASMSDGQKISHTYVTSLIGLDRNSRRYWAVIGMVRSRMLRDLNAVLNNEPGVGFIRATGEQQIQSGVGRTKRGIRMMARGVKIVSVVEDSRLADPAHRLQRDHIVQSTAILLQMGQAKRKELTLVINKPEALPYATALSASG